MIGCLWCNRGFTPRRGGSTQRFCSPGHRVAFHTAARQWAERAVAEGRLALAELRRGSEIAPVAPEAIQSNVHASGGAP